MVFNLFYQGFTSSQINITSFKVWSNPLPSDFNTNAEDDGVDFIAMSMKSQLIPV